MVIVNVASRSYMAMQYGASGKGETTEPIEERDCEIAHID